MKIIKGGVFLEYRCEHCGHIFKMPFLTINNKTEEECKEYVEQVSNDMYKTVNCVGCNKIGYKLMEGEKSSFISLCTEFNLTALQKRDIEQVLEEEGDPRLRDEVDKIKSSKARRIAQFMEIRANGSCWEHT